MVILSGICIPLMIVSYSPVLRMVKVWKPVGYYLFSKDKNLISRKSRMKNTPNSENETSKSTENQIFYCEINSVQKYQLQSTSDFFSILLFEGGEGIHTIDDRGYTIEIYQMYLIFPSQTHSWEVSSGFDLKVYEIQLSREFLDFFGCYLMLPFSFYKKNPVFKLTPEIFYKLLHEFKDINAEIINNTVFWKMMYSRIRIITLMIGKEARKVFSIKHNRTPMGLLIQFITLVLRKFKEERTVKFYADELCISSNYLNILCKKHFEKNAIAIINNELLLEVRYCLIVSVKPIKEIAYDFNFNDLSTFSSFFKKNTGMTPREFVNKYKNS